jgi:hypothetical protein
MSNEHADPHDGKSAWEIAVDANCKMTNSSAAPNGCPTALNKSDSEWKEATAMAEAWCQEKDPYKRDLAIYCYRAGYLRAKRHTVEAICGVNRK